MSQPNGSAVGVDTSGLRERLPQQPDAPQKAESVETAQEAVRQLNEQEQKGDKDEKDKKTYGRTPDGTGEYPRTRHLLALQLFNTSSVERACSLSDYTVEC